MHRSIHILLVVFVLVSSAGVRADAVGIRNATPGASANGETTTLISRAAGGSQSNGWSFYPDLSDDGRYIAFLSNASNLVAADTNGIPDVFVHDRATGKIERVTVSSNGIEANNVITSFDMSDTGRYVVFAAFANTLVPGDINGQPDIFLHDRATHTTTRIFETPVEREWHESRFPSISSDGQFVAFVSSYPLPQSPEQRMGDKVYILDLHSGSTSLVPLPGNDHAGSRMVWSSLIAGNGQSVAFVTNDSLDPRDTNYENDLYVYDREKGIFDLVTVDYTGQASRLLWTDTYRDYAVSDNGRYIGFPTGDNFLAGDENGGFDLYVYDRLTGERRRINIPYDGTLADGDTTHPSFSSNGRYVTFVSSATNLVPHGTSKRNIYVFDQVTEILQQVSVNSHGPPVISPDGRYIAFSAADSNLVDGDTNGFGDLLLRDRGQQYADTTPPIGTLTSPKANSTVGVTSLSLVATATDDISGSGVKAVTFQVLYDGSWHMVGSDATAPYERIWTIPADLRSQAISVRVQIADYSGNTTLSDTIPINVVESLNNPHVLENWTPKDKRAYLNQRALDPPHGDVMSGAASIAMLLAMNGITSQKPSMMTTLAMEIHPQTLNGGVVDIRLMQDALRRQGAHAMYESGTASDMWLLLKQEVDAGRSVIVRTAPHGMTLNGHFIVAVGYRETATTRHIIAYDPFGKWAGTVNQYYPNDQGTIADGSGKWVFYPFDTIFGTRNSVLLAHPKSTLTTASTPTSPPDAIYRDLGTLGTYNGVPSVVEQHKLFLPLTMH